MDEQTLRAIVREAVSRHLGAPAPAPGGRTLLIQPGHPSHVRYVLPETDGPCLIEPTVMCNHCGYCQSHGH
ncbi:MAG TPA: hypothetical protein VF190_04950 [Rhodothermales bacterium]